MREFTIYLSSVRQILNFVSLATVQPFDVRVENNRQWANGKSFLGMLTLDHSGGVCVKIDCDEAAFLAFREEAEKVRVH